MIENISKNPNTHGILREFKEGRTDDAINVHELDRDQKRYLKKVLLAQNEAEEEGDYILSLWLIQEYEVNVQKFEKISKDEKKDIVYRAGVYNDRIKEQLILRRYIDKDPEIFKKVEKILEILGFNIDSQINMELVKTEFGTPMYPKYEHIASNEDGHELRFIHSTESDNMGFFIHKVKNPISGTFIWPKILLGIINKPEDILKPHNRKVIYDKIQEIIDDPNLK